jgi:fatty-acyl-CoA synthase
MEGIPMNPGRMMDFPLTLTHLLEHARRYFPRTEIVSRGPDGKLHRQTWSDTYDRSCKLASALTRLGVKQGDRVATLAWNHNRHLEAYYGVPMMGAVVHTLNLRLHPSEIGYIARHAGDSVVLVDRSLLPLLNQFVESVPSIRHVIVMADDGPTPEGKLDYEQLLAAEPAAYDWPRLDENAAATICYTSGTTGNPKGVVYSHRSNVLHALTVCLPDVTDLSHRDCILPVVPMFHANCWGFAHSAALIGAKLVFPGPKLDPESLLDLMAHEKVTTAAGVPTIWIGILALLDANPKKWDLSSLKKMMVGGSAAPPAMIDGFDRRHGLTVRQAWGMTETNPVGSVALVKQGLETTPEARMSCRASQGFAVPFVEMRHCDDQGRVLPWDGELMGELEVRGPWVAKSYIGDEGKDRWTPDGWFKTGDVVTIDAEGYVRICDRSKDVIKSGGEWISSVALENALMSHPCVLEAAVFAGRHPKWAERPIAAIVLKKDKQATSAELGEHIAGQFAKFWMPDAYVFVEQIPRTSTGKFLKTRLRETYGAMLEKKGDT